MINKKNIFFDKSGILKPASCYKGKACPTSIKIYSSIHTPARYLRVGVNVIEIPLKRLTLERGTKRISVRNIAVFLLHYTRIDNVEKLLVIVHPDLG